MAPAARAGEPLGGSETRLKRLACCLYDVLWPGERAEGGGMGGGCSREWGDERLYLDSPGLSYSVKTTYLDPACGGS